jgi:hypothetical protein
MVLEQDRAGLLGTVLGDQPAGAFGEEAGHCQLILFLQCFKV